MCRPRTFCETETFAAATAVPGFIYYCALASRQPWAALLILAVAINLAANLVRWRRHDPAQPPGRCACLVLLGLAVGAATVALLESCT